MNALRFRSLNPRSVFTGMKWLLPPLLSAVVLSVQAQPVDGTMPMNEFRNPKKRQVVQIPDFGGFLTLKCDLHMHTVFSDGLVWPNIRVQEAWQEGLDVIAITDHVEYQPHRGDIVVNHNRGYELVRDMAAENNIVLIKGTEITRNTPPGHFNAIFVGDVSGFIEDRTSGDMDRKAIQKAVDQNAFIFWNHPGWKAGQIEGSYAWIELVDSLHREGSLHGIEVFNGFYFHKKALDWCIDKGLAVMGSSDIHNLVKHDYDLGGYVNRSMTLVLAKERTAASVREALEAGRTIAWASKYVAGREELVRGLFSACVEMGSRFHSRRVRSGSGVETVTHYYEIRNKSDLYFELELKSGNGTRQVTLYPRSTQIITTPDGQGSLTYEVVTAFVRSDRNLVVEFPLR